MLPYPNCVSAVHRAAFCFRENAVVRKKLECWTCSWCRIGSDVLAADAKPAQQCNAAVPHSRKAELREPGRFKTAA